MDREVWYWFFGGRSEYFILGKDMMKELVDNLVSNEV